MNLKVYLAIKNMSQKDFASQLDIEPNYLSRIVNEKVTPGRKLARHIEKATEGQITYNLPKKKADCVKTA